MQIQMLYVVHYILPPKCSFAYCSQACTIIRQQCKERAERELRCRQLGQDNYLGWLADLRSNSFPLVGFVLLDRCEESCTLPYDFSNGSAQILFSRILEYLKYLVLCKLGVVHVLFRNNKLCEPAACVCVLLVAWGVR